MDVLKEGLLKVKEQFGNEDKRNLNVIESESDFFLNIYNYQKSRNNNIDYDIFKQIPKFHNVLEGGYGEESLLSKMMLETRSLFLQKIDNSLLDTQELEILKTLLEQHSFSGPSGEKLITYTSLKKALSNASKKCKSYFTARVFAQLLTSDPVDRISIVPLFTYAMRKTWLKKTRIGLSVYDTVGKGYLRECELESFITDLIPECPQLRGLTKAFCPFYVCTVVRKFMFLLDPMATGRIRLMDIMTSNFLDDLLALRNEELPGESHEDNWFSPPSALKVYGQYLYLDKDRNGMLSKDELAAIGTGTVTDVLIERVFQECLTYDGEMDYKGYLDFVLALENKKEPQALRYFFRLFDINGVGYLDSFALNYFFRGIQEKMHKHQQNPISFEDVKDELFDMVRPADPLKITFQDLLNSEQADSFISILTDLNEFWNYENRDCN